MVRQHSAPQVVKDGRDVFTLHPEETAEYFAKLTPNDQKFYRLGVAEVVNRRINSVGVNGDETKAIMKARMFGTSFAR
jgi:hypothetical protein